MSLLSWRLDRACVKPERNFSAPRRIKAEWSRHLVEWNLSAENNQKKKKKSWFLLSFLVSTHPILTVCQYASSSTLIYNKKQVNNTYFSSSTSVKTALLFFLEYRFKTILFDWLQTNNKDFCFASIYFWLSQEFVPVSVCRVEQETSESCKRPTWWLSEILLWNCRQQDCIIVKAQNIHKKAPAAHQLHEICIFADYRRLCVCHFHSWKNKYDNDDVARRKQGICWIWLK